MAVHRLRRRHRRPSSPALGVDHRRREGYFAKAFHESRLNFAVDLLFFISVILIMVSGFAIPKVALPGLGLAIAFSPAWKAAHAGSALAALITMGIHCGLHAAWIAHNVKLHLITPAVALLRRTKTARPLSEVES